MPTRRTTDTVHTSMSALTRRELLALSIAGVSTIGTPRMSGAQPDRRWGVQLYTVRDQLAKDAAATLERIAAIGYTELEIMQPTLDVVAPLAGKLGLTIVSAHLDGPTAAGAGLLEFAAKAKAHGVRYLVVPFVPPAARPKDRAGFTQIGQRLARMAEDARAAGLDLCYHNHAFEFATDTDGTRWLDVLMQETAASPMTLELDVFWAAVTGADPVAVMRQYPGRIALVHLKDKDPRAANVLVETHVARQTFVEVGSGALDFPAILAAARTAGVKHYFVEQDYTPGDPVESLKKSYTYLTGLR